MNNNFGPHLMLDLSECPRETLSSMQHVWDLLYTLPEHINMTKITQPHVFPYQGLVPADKGITGVVIIAESHISVHTFEAKGYVFVDIFSCKPFAVDEAQKYIVDHFKAGKVTRNFAERGHDFPHE